MMPILKTHAPAALTPSERHLLFLLSQGQTPAQAAEALHLTWEEAQRLLVRALVHGWLRP